MGPKILNGMAMAWFISMLICLVMEGTPVGTGHNVNTVINDLSILSTLNIGSNVSIPVLNLTFGRGVMRLLTFDYSFYTGGFTFLRWMWTAILSPGVAYGIGMAFVTVGAAFVGRF